MANGSAIERGSLICAYDERETTLFQKGQGMRPQDGCWDSLRSGSIICPSGERGETVFAKPHYGLSILTTPCTVRVVSLYGCSAAR